MFHRSGLPSTPQATVQMDYPSTPRTRSRALQSHIHHSRLSVLDGLESPLQCPKQVLGAFYGFPMSVACLGKKCVVRGGGQLGARVLINLLTIAAWIPHLP